MKGPFHQHDCKKCQFIASSHGSHGLSDWYYCDGAMIGKFSIVRRDSDEGSDYASWPDFILTPTYAVAKDMEDRVGLIENHILAKHMLDLYQEKQNG